ncbi:hypothetical protein SRRS_14760 [Sporomusa rhizae]
MLKPMDNLYFNILVNNLDLSAKEITPKKGFGLFGSCAGIANIAFYPFIVLGSICRAAF